MNKGSDKNRNKFAWLYLQVVAFSFLLSVMAFAPARWLGQLLEQQSKGRLSLMDADGTLWRGAASLGIAASANEPVMLLLPGRFQWQLSPLLLIGRVNFRLANAESLSHPLLLTGSWQQWQLGKASLLIPAERLVGMGAPLNTLALSGRIRVMWDDLRASAKGGQVELHGAITFAMDDIASRMSPIKPLGNYRLDTVWQGQQATLNLRAVQGPLLLQGDGMFKNGRIQFAGTADAAPGHEEKLANLLNLLGQRRQQGGKNVIAFEFK